VLEKSEIKALLTLLDDTDEDIVKHVTKKLLSFGREVIPLIDTITEFNDFTPLHIQRVLEIKNRIYFGDSEKALKGWIENGARNLIEGISIIDYLEYPDYDPEELYSDLDRLKLDVWIELSDNQSPVDKIRRLNHVFYSLYGFKGDTDDYHNIDNSVLHRVFQRRMGNPISLSIIYSTVCQKLGIPVFGVNLPQHFILAYTDERKYPADSSLKGHDYLEPEKAGVTLFYINAFNKGTIFSKWNIDQFIKQLGLEPRESYFEPCSNIDICMRVIRNLIFSHQKAEDNARSKFYEELLRILEPHSSNPGTV